MNNLNPHQLAAVESDARNIVVLGTPGCGKTAVLKERISRRLKENYNAKIAAITYTIAAAKELRERCEDIIGPDEGGEDVFIGTIHALALSMLRGPWAKYLPTSEPLTVMTEERNKRAVAEAVARVRYKGTKKAVAEEIEAGSWLSAGAEFSGISPHGTPENVVACAYYQACRKASLISYDDLIKVAADLCDAHEEESVFDELLVDEYQDVSEDTDRLCDFIPARYRFFIGDPRQSIFGFLGGSPQRLVSLSNLKAWTRFDLTQSYRCSAPVAAAANRLMSFQNGPKLPEMLAADNGDLDTGMSIIDAYSAEDEMDLVRAAIKKLLEPSTLDPQPSIAVLARTNFIVGQFAEYLQSKGIPVVQSDKAGMPENWEHVLALAAVIDQPHNDSLVHDLVTITKGAREADRMRDAAILAEQPMIEQLPGGAPPPGPTAQDAAGALAIVFHDEPGALALIVRAHERVGPDATVAELRLALNDPGLKERESEAGSVDVSTIHGYKGREADHVFMVAMNEGILPGPGDQAEMRRLAFVGITRARISCTLTCARERLMGTWSKAAEACKVSRFVSEAMGKGSL